MQQLIRTSNKKLIYFVVFKDIVKQGVYMNRVKNLQLKATEKVMKHESDNDRWDGITDAEVLHKCKHTLRRTE